MNNGKQDKTKYLKYLALLLFVLVIVIIPPLMPNTYYLGNLVIIGIYSIVVIGLCLLMGFAGQVSLGHAAFYGLGAYSSGLLTAKLGWAPGPAMIAAALITGLTAYIIGVPTLKLREHHLALATLGAGVIIYIFFNEQVNLTGGPSGFSGIPYFSIGPWQFSTETSYYYLVWAFVLVAIWFAGNVVNSRIGRALRALHGSETGASCMGIPVYRYKIQIFVVSAVYAGVAGSLYAHYVTFISPSPFSFSASVEFVVMAAIGGLASIWGPLLGASAVLFLTELLRALVPRLIPSAGGEFEIIFFGIILVVIMVFMPQGLTGTLITWWKKRNSRTEKLTLPPGEKVSRAALTLLPTGGRRELD